MPYVSEPSINDLSEVTTAHVSNQIFHGIFMTAAFIPHGRKYLTERASQRIVDILNASVGPRVNMHCIFCNLSDDEVLTYAHANCWVQLPQPREPSKMPTAAQLAVARMRSHPLYGISGLSSMHWEMATHTIRSLWSRFCQEILFSRQLPQPSQTREAEVSGMLQRWEVSMVPVTARRSVASEESFSARPLTSERADTATRLEQVQSPTRGQESVRVMSNWICACNPCQVNGDRFVVIRGQTCRGDYVNHEQINRTHEYQRESAVGCPSCLSSFEEIDKECVNNHAGSKNWMGVFVCFKCEQGQGLEGFKLRRFGREHLRMITSEVVLATSDSMYSFLPRLTARGVAAAAVKPICAACNQNIRPNARLLKKRECRTCLALSGIDGRRLHSGCCTKHSVCGVDAAARTSRHACHSIIGAGGRTKCASCGGCSSNAAGSHSGSCCRCTKCPGNDLSRPHLINISASRGQWCQECNRCKPCCQCSGVQFFQDESRENPTAPRGFNPFRAKFGQFRLNSMNRLIGVEIEVSGTETFKPIRTALEEWRCSVVSDGSIVAGRGGRGYEINSQPASGDLFCEQMDALGSALAAGKATANNSCGVHVHVDASDMGWWSVGKLIRLYAKLEPALFGIVEARRAKSTYCIPCGTKFMAGIENPASVKDVKEKVLLDQYGRSSGKAVLKQQGNKYHSARYNALNLHSWFLRGTVEFRHHHGSTQGDKIKYWALTCASIVDRAIQWGDKALADVPEGLDGLLALSVSQKHKEWLVSRWETFHPKGVARADILTPTDEQVASLPVESTEESCLLCEEPCEECDCRCRRCDERPYNCGCDGGPQGSD
jgi:hypothetical protein